MNKPKMIIFDYGQTLISEKPFNALKGTQAVLDNACKNPNNVSAEQVQALADELNEDIGRYGGDYEKHTFLEIHNFAFQKYLYEYYGIELTKTPEEVEYIFESSASQAEPTNNIDELLKFLYERNIRTAVISNISFSGKLLEFHINNYIPDNKFEFIIASSEYIFRKPHRRIFELALKKANLSADKVWYCGDNAVFDVDGAANCGIFPVWYKGARRVSEKYVPKSQCLEISDWKELINILK